MAISEPWVWIDGKLLSFNKSLGQTAPSAWECPKTQFWGPLTENLTPSQGLTHTLTPLSVNTQYRSKKKTRYGSFMIWIELSVILISKDLATCSSQKKKIPDTPTQTCWRWVQSQKGQPTPCKLCMHFPAHLCIREFGHKSTHPGLTPTDQNSSQHEMGRA